MHIIPAIDLIDGKCVRLTQGDYAQKTVYNEDPLAVAQAFAAAGLKKLHVVDLDGARGGGIVNHRVLEKIATGTALEIDWGGGIKSDEDLRIAFESGAHQVTGGTIAVKQPEVFLSWLERYGPEKIILGTDVRGDKIAVSGWEEASDRELFEFLANYVAHGVRYTICTDVSKDGLLQGTARALYGRIRREQPEVKLIASGGVTDTDDLDALAALDCYGVIVGKAIYEGRISLETLLTYQE
ncbi:1-(5-phosphoribosyl)-5-[(5-phosphoribosylamino)methylideneamino]imidazole-4-carboxamide isomerase [Neolewinella lacunae]|uniref:1-(5-phosphoribosyl)-5-[(5-phosphoribosylamino)methylideneamino] imidazole-4-carboxamide isomerase n=1 Tax=Neolewinella lacunae TaxID=1517758 RepID=A0A923PTB2_9BACT|nr:1-(5-phosphoribosyl)-5-[(5-phosphoribosylamino)methylideneamino]imidazole-4-carboxamide isomerase [Neolewinella lacunae]MBC6996427.1 1-(5-phosphoribosyl)-5-[(5-phosphoribosylamino)methylideneamino]imidazole-4-carboxamide isomerase [Neolewinella lacunae]MDN3633630.1 1-(5-phosphoribosyl)-5-[(5-phosphoribosylamino)methylideneamino]imidazole-4-carboxamide isomerase [Neolewinella lacunae]